jgi:hypothetical protein
MGPVRLQPSDGAEPWSNRRSNPCSAGSRLSSGPWAFGRRLRKAKKAAALSAVYQRMALTVQFPGHLPLTEAAIARYEDLQGLKLWSK